VTQDRPAKRYTLQGEIGQGGMSIIYQAFDHLLQHPVAMKVLKPAYAGERQRFLNEAYITGLLDHPHIVPVHDIGEDEAGCPYFTMKWIHGETLSHHLEAARDPTRALDSLERFLGIFHKICDAVAFAHSRGIVHRDIKPANIVIGQFGQVYLLDWGLARVIRPSALAALSPPLAQAFRQDFDPRDTLIGTLEYASPEQALGQHHQIDERTDIFLLGALLYYILIGRAPFAEEDGSLQERVLWAQSAEIRPPEEVAPRACLPPGISAIAMRAMAREPRHRYPSVVVLEDAVRRFLHSGLYLPTKTFSQGSLVMREGDAGDDAYIIVSGTCEVYKTVNGEKEVLCVMGPEEVFGETAILSSKPRTASVVALEDLTVLTVTADTLTSEMGLGSWAGRFARALAERFHDGTVRRWR
jgi:serine/threonine protein kinase